MSVIAWDYKQQIDLAKLRHILADFGLSLVEIETLSDEYAIVIGKAPMTKAQANQEYDKYCGRYEQTPST